VRGLEAQTTFGRTEVSRKELANHVKGKRGLRSLRPLLDSTNEKKKRIPKGVRMKACNKRLSERREAPIRARKR